MTPYYPDNPTAVSPDFLKKIDQDPPGTWIAQPKMDGFRRMCFKNGDQWEFMSKKGGAGDGIPLPEELSDALISMEWPEVFGLDCEWVGRRMIEHTKGAHKLYVFDLLIDKEAMFRMNVMTVLADRYAKKPNPFVEFVPAWHNPGLFDRFQEQMTNPLSEGLVVRRADSRHLMGRNGCLTHPAVFKIKYRNIREIKHERS